MKRTIKYKNAAAIVFITIAAVFSSCSSNHPEMISLENANISENTDGGIDKAEEKQTELLEQNHEDAQAIYVYVCGAVYNPGVYELEDTSRLIDAIKAAGGSCQEAGIEYLNLASKLSDGQKVYVPTYEEINEAVEQGYLDNGTGEGISSGIIGNSNITSQEISQNESTGKVNINRADIETLKTIPGIGESKAKKIISYRDENGGFSCIEDIMLISGIKEGMYNKIKDYICVD